MTSRKVVPPIWPGPQTITRYGRLIPGSDILFPSHFAGSLTLAACCEEPNIVVCDETTRLGRILGVWCAGQAVRLLVEAETRKGGKHSWVGARIISRSARRDSTISRRPRPRTTRLQST